MGRECDRHGREQKWAGRCDRHGREQKWAGRVTRMGESRNRMYVEFRWENIKEKRPVGRHTYGW
jgi:hypothetical protein